MRIQKSTMFLIALAIIGISTVGADEIDLKEMAGRYFDAKLATQQPDATKDDLEAYLALLSEDVGYEHKPFRLLGDVEGGKQRMREGMTYYLGANERYDAKLVSVAVGHNAIAIQYEGVHVFRRGGEGELLTEHFKAMESLEIEDGKVSIIREYRE